MTVVEVVVGVVIVSAVFVLGGIYGRRLAQKAYQEGESIKAGVEKYSKKL